jgi:uroporphyrinogen-III synthase
MTRLDGLGVLVTRPALQAASLYARLRELGADVHPLPAIEVVPRVSPNALGAAFDPIDTFDWIIFVSVNAVRFGGHLLNTTPPRGLIAIGPATTRALTHAGFRVDFTPAQGFDSEQLLTAPALQELSGKRILIVRGDDGRGLLADTLRARGATVQYAEVYERRCTHHAPAVLSRIEEQWADGAIQVVTATSGEIIKCLDTTLSPRGRELLRVTPLLVGSARIGEIARELGATGPLLVAARPDDQGLIEALQAWGRTPRRAVDVADQ